VWARVRARAPRRARAAGKRNTVSCSGRCGVAVRLGCCWAERRRWWWWRWHVPCGMTMCRDRGVQWVFLLLPYTGWMGWSVGVGVGVGMWLKRHFVLLGRDSHGLRTADRQTQIDGRMGFSMKPRRRQQWYSSIIIIIIIVIIQVPLTLPHSTAQHTSALPWRAKVCIPTGGLFIPNVSTPRLSRPSLCCLHASEFTNLAPGHEGSSACPATAEPVGPTPHLTSHIPPRCPSQRPARSLIPPHRLARRDFGCYTACMQACAVSSVQSCEPGAWVPGVGIHGGKIGSNYGSA
jgi:hypothetical protein